VSDCDCRQTVNSKIYTRFESTLLFSISNFRRVLNVVFFIVGVSPASEFYVPVFRNTLFHLTAFSSQLFFLLTPPMKMGLTECSKTSEQNSNAGESPKRKNTTLLFFPSEFDLFLPTRCRCGGLLLHMITLKDTHTRTHTQTPTYARAVGLLW